MYLRKNVVKPLGQSPGAAAPKDPNVTIIATDDILTWPMRDSKNVNIVGDYVLKPGAKMIQVYMTPSKIKASMDPEGEEDTVTYKQKFEGPSPGNSLELAEFVQNWTGVNAIIIYGSCQEAFRKVMGTKCAPMQLKASLKDDNDSREHNLMFEQFAKSGFVPGHYTGNLVFDAPFDVALVTAVAVNPTNGYQYKLPSLAVTAAIVFASNTLEHGQTFTLIGGGGVAPATLASGVTDKSAMLVNGTTWVALLNATITLRVFKTGAITLYEEVART